MKTAYEQIRKNKQKPERYYYFMEVDPFADGFIMNYLELFDEYLYTLCNNNSLILNGKFYEKKFGISPISKL